MKFAWIILLISALTDFVVTAATGVITAMTATGSAALPNRATIVLCSLGGAVAAMRTIQQALKATPETAAALRGDTSIVKTATVSTTP